MNLLLTDEVIAMPMEILNFVPFYARKFAKALKEQCEHDSELYYIPCSLKSIKRHRRLGMFPSKVPVVTLQVLAKTALGYAATALSIKMSQAHFANLADVYSGVLHGTHDSLPEYIKLDLPGLPVINVPIHKTCENYQYPSNIEKNITAIASAPPKKILVYGASTTGKSCLARTIANRLKSPWISFSPRILERGLPIGLLVPILKYLQEVCEERKITILLDDIEELMAMTFVPTHSTLAAINGNSQQENSMLLYGCFRDMIESPNLTVISVASIGKYPIDHVVSSCDAFFNTGLSKEETKEVWRKACPGTPAAAEDIANERLGIPLIYAIANQSKALAKANKRKRPTLKDVSNALSCFGTDVDNDMPMGFGRK